MWGARSEKKEKMMIEKNLIIRVGYVGCLREADILSYVIPSISIPVYFSIRYSRFSGESFHKTNTNILKSRLFIPYD